MGNIERVSTRIDVEGPLKLVDQGLRIRVQIFRKALETPYMISKPYLVSKECSLVKIKIHNKILGQNKMPTGLSSVNVTY